jgi:transposase-like protein
MKVSGIESTKGLVHCPICTHTVPAQVEVSAKRMKVLAGQKCPRCQSSLDAAAVLYLAHAA